MESSRVVSHCWSPHYKVQRLQQHRVASTALAKCRNGPKVMMNWSLFRWKSHRGVGVGADHLKEGACFTAVLKHHGNTEA